MKDQQIAIRAHADARNKFIVKRLHAKHEQRLQNASFDCVYI